MPNKPVEKWTSRSMRQARMTVRIGPSKQTLRGQAMQRQYVAAGGS